jgi:hypothetical protein
MAIELTYFKYVDMVIKQCGTINDNWLEYVLGAKWELLANNY